MKFKRTIALASSMTIIAFVGVMYMSNTTSSQKESSALTHLSENNYGSTHFATRLQMHTMGIISEFKNTQT